MTLPCLLGLLALLSLLQPPVDRAARWEKEIAAIEKRLTAQPPPKGGVAFVGSSSIGRWDLKKSFPDRNVVNLGFGGSELRDSTHFAKRLFIPLEPKTVVLYAGDNDLAAGRTPEQVRDDFRDFVAKVHADLPKARVLFVAVKPSPKRWSIYEAQKRANNLVKAVCSSDERLEFIDVVPAMLGTDGKPIAELFVKDELHLSAKGYEVWTEAIKKALRN